MKKFNAPSFFVLLLLAGSVLWFPACAADFKLGGRTLTVPDGFEIEVVAGPPLVERPVSADFDEQGRLYVTDSSGSNEKPEQQLKDKPHRVVRLEDTDGDGKFDKSTVFADKLMFPEGALWRDGSLYVGAPPSIWKFTATDGIGAADQREEWFQGKTLTGCANDLHGPYAGPDGWIYWCKGAFAKQTYERPGKEPFVTRAAHIFRCRADGSGFEPVMTGGMDNPVGVAFTVTGERILSGTFFQNPEGGKRDGLIHAIYGGVYGKVNDVVDGHPRTGELLPIMTHLGPAAPCGITRYRSEIFGPDYQDNLFTCCFNLRKVVRSVLVPDGATFKTKDSDFLTSDDPDFHPTGVLEDADGSLIVLNTGGWYKICCPTSQLAKPDVLGEIYRIRRKGAPAVTDPRGLKINWSSASPKVFLDLLDDPRPAVRDRAIARLVKQGGAIVEPFLAGVASLDTNHTSPEMRRNVLWVLDQIDSPPARAYVRSVLMDPDNTVRHIAVLSMGLWRDTNETGNLEYHLLRDKDAQVRRGAAEALGRIGKPNSIPQILAAAGENIDDRALEHSLIYALIEIGGPAETARGLASPNSRTRRAALIALDQMPNGHLEPESVTPLLVSTDPLLKATANWIVSHHHDWGGALAGFFATQLALPDMSEAEADALQSLLAPLAGDPAIQAQLARSLESGPAWSRLVVLRAMAHSNLKPAPPAWLRDVSTELRSRDADVLRESIATARALNAPKGGGAELNGALAQVSADANLKTETRLAALAAEGPLGSIPSNVFNFVTGNLDPSGPWAIRNNAAVILSKASLDHGQLLQLAAMLRGVGPAELPKLLGSFEASTNEAIGLSLIENLKSAKAITSLRADALQQKIAKYPETVRNRAGELYKLMNADAAGQKAHLDQLQAQLPPGDVRRGQAVFNSPKAACSSCHAIGYLGGHVGPDLTTVGTIRTERDLLESIVYPSASFVRSFEPMIVSTKAGEDYTGVIRRDTADEVVLVTGPQVEVRIARADIVEMRQGIVSLMPQGFDELLTRQELSDLVTFLKHTKWGPK